MIKREVIDKLIEQVQRLAERPNMYLKDVTVASATSFQSGIHCACSAMDIDLSTALCSGASNSRGWEFGSTGSVNPMRECGLTEEQIVRELLLNQVKLLEMVRDKLED